MHNNKKKSKNAYFLAKRNLYLFSLLYAEFSFLLEGKFMLAKRLLQSCVIRVRGT